MDWTVAIGCIKLIICFHSNIWTPIILQCLEYNCNVWNQLTSATDCKQRWRIAKEVLHSTKTVPSRSVDDLKQLCSKFSKYFIDKISSLKLTIAATLAGLHVFPSPDPMHLGGAFDTISHVFC